MNIIIKLFEKIHSRLNHTLFPNSKTEMITEWILNGLLIPFLLMIMLTLPIALLQGLSKKSEPSIIFIAILIIIFLYWGISLIILPIYYIFYTFTPKYKEEKEKRFATEKSNHIKQAIEESKAHEERVRLWKEKERVIQEELEKNKVNELVRNFAEKHCQLENNAENITKINPSEIKSNYLIDEEKLETLINLLEVKYNTKIKREDLEELIVNYRSEQEKDKLHNQIYTYDDNAILKAYVEYSGDNALRLDHYIPLTKVLNEKYSTEDLIEKIEKAIKLNTLNTFENKLKTKSLSISEIDQLAGKEFENEIAKAYQSQGYTILKVLHSNDQGADIIMTKFNKKIVIQAKRWKGSVPNKAIQEVATARTHYDCDEAWIVTNSYLTKQAIALAKTNKVKIFDRDSLKTIF